MFAAKKFVLRAIPSCVSLISFSFFPAIRLLLVGLHRRNSPAFEKCEEKTSMGGWMYWIKLESYQVAWI